jgi:serine phosphatase RsbU (regulator of sigma subunit)
MQKKAPRYHIFRIFISALLIYFFIKGPISIFLILNQSPGLITSQSENNQNHQTVEIQSDIKEDKNQDSNINININFSNTEINRSIYFISFLFLSFLLLFIFNLPFKKYFRRKRKQQFIPDSLLNYCKKYLLKAPAINSSIIAFPFLGTFFIMLIKYIKGTGQFDNEEIRHVVEMNFYVNLTIAFLVALFSYQWQKIRIQLKHIDHIFPFDELKPGIFKKSKGIHLKIWLSNVVTTLLPLIIIILYISLSFSTMGQLGIEDYSECHNKVLLGKYYSMFSNTKTIFAGMPYINAFDSILMILGISFSVITSLLYVSIMAKWISRSIAMPTQELLNDMNTTGEGDIQSYSIVRSNDEIGQLTTGYNNMVTKLREYFNELKDLNRNLEQKVDQRTKEIRQQKEEIETQRDEITQQRDQLSVKNKEINDSIFYARNIQEALLPEENQFEKNLPDHFILFKPRDIVSGDFYWIKQIRKEVIFTAADCTGHGVPGAFMSMLGMSFLNEIVQDNKKLQPNQILNELREQVKTALKQESEETKSKDGMDMALVKLNTDTLNLEFAGAYNPLYIIRNGKLIVYKADRMPIGAQVKEENTFTNQKIKLQQGDILYMFSDGYPDQFGGPNNKKFTKKRFKELLIEISNKSLHEQKRLLDQKHKDWMGQNTQLDDILIIGVKIH